MTNFSKTNATKSRKASRFSMLALALSLSAGTVAGMLSIAALTSGPAQAQSAGNGGNGGNGGGGPAGGAGGGAGPMIADIGPKVVDDRPRPNRNPNVPPRRATPAVCEGNLSALDAEKCKHNQRSTPRIVRINGFAQCAIVQQVPNPNGGPADFFCLKTM